MGKENYYFDKIGYAVGTGRCGTTLIYRLLGEEPHISSCHERNVFSECFHRYSKWYGLPVDDSGFIRDKKKDIDHDLLSHQFSFESSAPLSFSIKTLYQVFHCRFVLFVRSPEKVVNSYLSKNWYTENIHWDNTALAPGFQTGNLHLHHFFSRTIPRGDDFHWWVEMGRIGRLAWFWNAVNREVLAQFRELPESHWMTVRLEDFSYDTYRSILEFFRLESRLSPARFDRIASSRPNKRFNLPTTGDWTKKDIQEFEAMIQPMASRCGYPSRFSEYPLAPPSRNLEPKRNTDLGTLQRLRIAFRRAVMVFSQELRSKSG